MGEPNKSGGGGRVMKMHGNDHCRSNEGILVGQAYKYCYRGLWGQFCCYFYPRGMELVQLLSMPPSRVSLIVQKYG